MTEKDERFLIGLALFTMGQKHFRKCEEFETALAQHLGYPQRYMGHISDAMLKADGDFAAALAKEERTTPEDKA